MSSGSLKLKGSESCRKRRFSGDREEFRGSPELRWRAIEVSMEGFLENVGDLN